MEKQNNDWEDLINRYIYQVTKRLSVKTRKDIEAELRTLIYDMLEDKTNGNSPTKKDIEVVLKELGRPVELAGKYRDNSGYLIGPSLFPAYLLIMKIVISATLFGMTIVTILELLTSSHTQWYDYLGSWSSNLIGGLFMSFAWVTLIFAIFEWKGVNLKELMTEWEVSSLPPVPTNETTIPLWEPIAGIIFTIFVMIVFVSSPHLIGTYHFSDGMTTIAVFNLEVLRTVLPLFLICFGLGILKNIWEIVERRYSIKYAILTLVIDPIEIVLTIIIFTRFPIWNKNFIAEHNALLNIGSDVPLDVIWNTITSNMIIFLILIYILDIATAVYKSLKFEGKSFFNK